jgi:hypothetical protein
VLNTFDAFGLLARCNTLQAFYQLSHGAGACASSAGVKEQYAKQWLQGAKWAAITIVVVGSPVLGKVTGAPLHNPVLLSAAERFLVILWR